MQQIINFIIKSRNTLWFLFLLLIAVGFTIQSHTYHTNKFINSTSTITGGVYGLSSGISNYFNLKSYNERLLIENTKLKQQLQKNKSLKQYDISSSLIDSSKVKTDNFLKFIYKPAEVINSTYHKKKNYLTINKGIRDDINPDMGVITDLGIVGIVENTSNNYATVISILNENSRINAQLKKTNHFGSLIWNGKEVNVVQLIDIPRLAPITVGDTIITGGRSTIFPKEIPVGVVKDFSLNDDESYYTVNVNLFNDMTNIGFVQVIKNNETVEVKSLESQSDE